MTAARERDDSGLLTLDGIVGLSIVVVGVVGVMQTQALALSMIREAAASRSLLVAAEYRLATEWPKLARAGSLSGGDGRDGWRLTATVHTPAKTNAPALCKVDSLAWMHGRRSRIQVSTISICKADTPR